MRGTFFSVLVGLCVLSQSGLASTIALSCSETRYLKGGNHAYDVPQWFLFTDGGLLSASTLKWDNEHTELKVVSASPIVIEATGKSTADMPLPKQVDDCINEEVKERPDMREPNGTINVFTVLGCVDNADASTVPVDVTVSINRVTGDLKIIRQQDQDRHHDTEHDGSCKPVELKF